MVYLQQFGLSNAIAAKIYDTYGMKLYAVMRENPYRLAEDIRGIGFRMADELAASLGATTRQLSILNWLPYTGCLTYSP